MADRSNGVSGEFIMILCIEIAMNAGNRMFWPL
jgi:hypothetical protein